MDRYRLRIGPDKFHTLPGFLQDYFKHKMSQSNLKPNRVTNMIIGQDGSIVYTYLIDGANGLLLNNDKDAIETIRLVRWL